MDMVERVARDVNDRLAPEIRIAPWDSLDERMKDECRTVVRMVIEAMREPTPDMTWAAFEKALVPVMDFKPAWYAAIDSILKSTRETA